jgi:hypothetical protein
MPSNLQADSSVYQVSTHNIGVGPQVTQFIAFCELVQHWPVLLRLRQDNHGCLDCQIAGRLLEILTLLLTAATNVSRGVRETRFLLHVGSRRALPSE